MTYSCGDKPDRPDVVDNMSKPSSVDISVQHTPRDLSRKLISPLLRFPKGYYNLEDKQLEYRWLVHPLFKVVVKLTTQSYIKTFPALHERRGSEAFAVLDKHRGVIGCCASCPVYSHVTMCSEKDKDSMTISWRSLCQLHLQNYTDTVDNNTYQRGTCHFTMYLPPSAGNYSYIIHIRPGPAQDTGVEVWTDNLKPSCAKFLQENPNGSCECYERDLASSSYTGGTTNYVCNIVRGSTSQSTPPSLTPTSQTPNWNNRYHSSHNRPTSTTTATTLSSTTRTTKTPQSSHDSFRGLQPVNISTNATQPFVTDGTTQMALFCQTDDVYPAVRYTWAGVTCINEHHKHGTCIFTPRVPQDDGRQVTNLFSLVFSDPPPSPPIIRGYEEGSVLTEGEKFILDCEVKGGKPKVRSVRFVCVDEPDNPDIVDGMSVWSRVLINVKTKHDNTVCLCSATWSPQPRFYSNTTFLRLYVNVTLFDMTMNWVRLHRLKVTPVSQSPLGSLQEVLQPL
ncbi:hypothetical protein C0Q70_12839 [Pomacea canaliculata]|uniref:Ig-like domain-containing protein n=1 Tax=Pomacea canaliculata TaxID=400727 RepID=A0A2T7P2L9_POMCA|nr:hypothetical protein C0Q70_12839 [Pomacea canaliculata]